MSYNGTFGLENVSKNYTDAPGPELNETTSYIGDVLGPTMSGTPELSGVMMLGIIMFGMYKADVGTDLAAVALVPTSLFLADKGFLPYGDGIIFGVLMGVSAVVTFGVFKWAFR